MQVYLQCMTEEFASLQNELILSLPSQWNNTVHKIGRLVDGVIEELLDGRAEIQPTSKHRDYLQLYMTASSIWNATDPRKTHLGRPSPQLDGNKQAMLCACSHTIWLMEWSDCMQLSRWIISLVGQTQHEGLSYSIKVWGLSNCVRLSCCWARC